MMKSSFTVDLSKPAATRLPALLRARRVQKGPAPLACGAGTRTAHSAHYFLTASIFASLPLPPLAVPTPPCSWRGLLTDMIRRLIDGCNEMIAVQVCRFKHSALRL